MASTDALALPLKNTAFRIYFPVYKSDGSLIQGWTGAAATRSLDGATAAGSTNTPTEIATTSGLGYLDLTAAEMNTNNTIISVTVTNTNALPTVISLYPATDAMIHANVMDWNSSAVATPATAGVPDVNAKNINNVATTSVATINANVGTTQPTNFTGTGASALAKADMVDVAGTASAGAAGYVALDWGHINAPTTVVDLSGTKINTLDNAAPDSTAVTEINADVDELIVTIGSPAGVSIAADIAEVEGETDSLLTNVATIPTNPLLTTDSRLNTLDATISSRLPTVDLVSDSGTAQSGSATNIRLRAGAPANGLAGQTVFIQSGTGALQSSPISAYNTSTKDATTVWTTAPDATSVYVVLALQGGSSSGGSGTTSAFSGAAATEIDAIKAKTDLIGVPGAQVFSTAPISGTRKLVRGMDYKAADNNAIVVTAPAGFPSFAGGSNATLSLLGIAPIAGSILSATQLSFDVPRASSASAAGGAEGFKAYLTLASGDIVFPEISQLVLVG